MATKRKSKRKTQTKKDLEAKIAELEGKLSQISSQLGQKPAEQAQKAPPPPPKPAEAPPAAKAPPAPKEQAAPPVTRDSLIEAVSVGVWHDRKTKTPGYVAQNPRAWARRHAEGADAPTHPWALQKSKITGYTAPSNKYFATRQRLAYHPPETSFTGYGISLGHGVAQTQTQSAPPPPPPPPQQTQGKLPKGTAASSGRTGKSRQQELEEYEKDYLARLDSQHADDAAKAAQAQAQASASKTHGTLPKGF